MSCEVAELSFQAHVYYGTWSIEFDHAKFESSDNLGEQ